jgi:hypothetical protein
MKLLIHFKFLPHPCVNIRLVLKENSLWVDPKVNLIDHIYLQELTHAAYIFWLLLLCCILKKTPYGSPPCVWQQTSLYTRVCAERWWRLIDSVVLPKRTCIWCIVWYSSFHVNAGPDVGIGKKTTGVPVVLLPKRSLKLSISNVTFKL